jgi:hypothetical protein
MDVNGSHRTCVIGWDEERDNASRQYLIVTCAYTLMFQRESLSKHVIFRADLACEV